MHFIAIRDDGFSGFGSVLSFVAENDADAEQQLQGHLDAAWRGHSEYNERKRKRPSDLDRASWSIHPLPTVPGVFSFP